MAASPFTQLRLETQSAAGRRGSQSDAVIPLIRFLRYEGDRT